MNIINNEKTQIVIKKDVYKLNEIELIYTEKNVLVICVNSKRVKYKCEDAPKEFRYIASQIIINQLNNFVLLLTGNNMVNINKIEEVSLMSFDLKIRTQHHLYILSNANCMEYMCLKQKIKNNKTSVIK